MKTSVIEHTIPNEKETDHKVQEPRIGRFAITVIVAFVVALPALIFTWDLSYYAYPPTNYEHGSGVGLVLSGFLHFLVLAYLYAVIALLVSYHTGSLVKTISPSRRVLFGIGFVLGPPLLMVGVAVGSALILDRALKVGRREGPMLWKEGIRFLVLALLAGACIVPTHCQAAEEAPPEEVRQVLGKYLEACEERDFDAVRKMLCFVDDEDERLFAECSRWAEDKRILAKGEVTEQGKAAEDCWLFLVGRGTLIELWKVGDEWKVLSPVSGTQRTLESKVPRGALWLALADEETKRVEGESEEALLRRRGRYIAALKLSPRDSIRNLHRYCAGIPEMDAEALAKMPLEDFRQAVIAALKGPTELLYRVEPGRDVVIEGDPVPVTFYLENTTGRPISLKFMPCFGLMSGGHLVFPRALGGGKGTWTKKRPPGVRVVSRRYSYPLKPVYPFEEKELTIAVGETASVKVNLLDYYDLVPGRYRFYTRIDARGGQGFWRGHAISETRHFEVKYPTVSFQPDAQSFHRFALEKPIGLGVGLRPIVVSGRGLQLFYAKSITFWPLANRHLTARVESATWPFDDDVVTVHVAIFDKEMGLVAASSTTRAIAQMAADKIRMNGRMIDLDFGFVENLDSPEYFRVTVASARAGQEQAPVKLEIAAGRAEYKIGEQVDVSVTLTNVSDEAISVVGSLDGSGAGFRYPQYHYLIVGPAGEFERLSGAWCDKVASAKADDFVALEPGESFDPYGEGFGKDPGLEHWRPQKPGDYKILLLYSSESPEDSAWHPDSRDPEVARRLAKVPRCSVCSNIITVKVVGF